MRAAIYARRSTDEHQAASLHVQVDEARRFAESKGWTIAPEHTFVDDAVSRAEFKKRPGLLSMLAAAQRGEFDVIIMRDESRLGGDMVRTTLVLSDLIDAGVRIFHYDNGEEVRLDRPEDKLLVSFRNYAAEIERAKTAQRTRDHL